MEISIIKLMQKLEVIPEEIGKMMEQSANQREQNPQQQIPNMQQQPNLMPGMQPGMMMPPPGMMPGNNPMEMLQMQQMQQMQQMFGQFPPQQQQPPKWCTTRIYLLSRIEKNINLCTVLEVLLFYKVNI